MGKNNHEKKKILTLRLKQLFILTAISFSFSKIKPPVACTNFTQNNFENSKLKTPFNQKKYTNNLNKNESYKNREKAYNIGKIYVNKLKKIRNKFEKEIFPLITKLEKNLLKKTNELKYNEKLNTTFNYNSSKSRESIIDNSLVLKKIISKIKKNKPTVQEIYNLILDYEKRCNLNYEKYINDKNGAFYKTLKKTLEEVLKIAYLQFYQYKKILSNFILSLSEMEKRFDKTKNDYEIKKMFGHTAKENTSIILKKPEKKLKKQKQ